MCVIIGSYVFAVWCILYMYFGVNMNQFEMEKLKRANVFICGEIYAKKARNDTKSGLKCHGIILFYTSKRHRNTSKYRVNTTSMKRRESDVTQ